MRPFRHSDTVIDEHGELEKASRAFLTDVPSVSLSDAAQVAREAFGIIGDVRPLSGERDRNFLIRPAQGAAAVTLKFINAAEPWIETEMQIEVLKHLAGRCPVPVPAHRTPPSQPADWLDWKTAAGQTWRVRCYSFLEGLPGSDLRCSAQAWRSLGVAIAQLHRSLADFNHPGADRQFLWDARRAPLLRPWLDVVENAHQRQRILTFWRIFESRLARLADKLPVQTIHNDLSPSNLLCTADGIGIAGVLDFGDMLHAPRVADLAIAASYQMALTDQPADALQAMLAGYESLLALDSTEHELLPDLILARLTQRMVITAWRARCYPENSTYILRSQATATALFNHLIEGWLQMHAQA